LPSIDERLFISLGGGLIMSSSSLFNDKFFERFSPGIVSPTEAIPKLRFYVGCSFFFLEIGGFMFLDDTKSSSVFTGLLKEVCGLLNELKLWSSWMISST
jgi:hypothetical protein